MRDCKGQRELRQATASICETETDTHFMASQFRYKATQTWLNLKHNFL